MLLYNVVQLLTQYLAEAEKIPVAAISQENVFYDVHRQLIAWNEIVPPSVTAVGLHPILTAQRLRDRLQLLLSNAWSSRWLKAPPKKRSTPHHDPAHIPGTHTSMFRLIHGKPDTKRSRRQRK